MYLHRLVNLLAQAGARSRCDSLRGAAIKCWHGVDPELKISNHPNVTVHSLRV